MKKKNYEIKSAFSLVELAIVLIIIALLVVGVIAGQKMVSLARLASARTLTNSSPVHTVEDLIIWWESTSKASFNKSQRIDGATITSWSD